MDADANANADAAADPKGSTMALHERCSGKLKKRVPITCLYGQLKKIIPELLRNTPP